jgi:hypothetical protein
MVMVMAYAHVLLDNHDAALDEIELLLSMPGEFSTSLIELDPLLRPLLDHPRCQALLAQGDKVF